MSYTVGKGAASGGRRKSRKDVNGICIGRRCVWIEHKGYEVGKRGERQRLSRQMMGVLYQAKQCGLYTRAVRSCTRCILRMVRFAVK